MLDWPVYFAYGSNLHPLRLQARTPSASLIGVGRLNGYQLAFGKIGQDDSGKCFLRETTDGWVDGALFRIDPAERKILDRFEGVGQGYSIAQMPVQCHPLAKPLDLAGHKSVQEGDSLSVFLYMADLACVDLSLPPFDWYRDLVLVGAQYLGFSASALSEIAAVSAIPDADSTRASIHQRLLESCQQTM